MATIQRHPMSQHPQRQAFASASAAAGHSAAVAHFPWPFLLHPPTGPVTSSSSPSPTPNFDSILAHVAGSALSPIVDGRFPASASKNGGSSMSRLIGSMGPMSRTRFESLSKSLAEFERAQARYYASATLHQITGEIVDQLNAAQSPPSSGASYAAAAADNHSALVADVNCLWHLAQSEPFLMLEAEVGAAAAVAPAAGGASVPDPDPSLFGLQWSSLSGAFKPQSSAIPLAPSASGHHSSSALQATTASRSHTFAAPARSALGASLSSLLVPEIESALSERVDQAWNDFDPQATEREAEEQAALRADRGEEDEDDLQAAAGEGENSLPNRITPAAPLPSLDSASLPSLLSHRLARLARLEDRVSILRRNLALQQSLHSRTILSTLSATSTLLAEQTLRTESAVQQASLSYLQGKMSVLAEKIHKVEADVQRDTYLGIASPHKDASAGAEHIIPSLRVIGQSLTALRSSQQSDLREKTRALQRYQSMGAAFTELAEELASIQKQIENKKWTLQRMK